LNQQILHAANQLGEVAMALHTQRRLIIDHLDLGEFARATLLTMSCSDATHSARSQDLDPSRRVGVLWRSRTMQPRQPGHAEVRRSRASANAAAQDLDARTAASLIADMKMWTWRRPLMIYSAHLVADPPPTAAFGLER
jgi:hypothetical protein